MQDESIMAYGLTAFAGAIIAWAYYNYRVRQKQKSMSADEILASWATFNKEPAVKVKPTLKKATTMATKPGLYSNIHAKQKRIEKEKAEGKPVEKMRKPGTKGAPTAKAFEQSAKTAKKK